MENINFKASLVAPDSNEVMYWVDLNENKLGKSIKVYNADTKLWENVIVTPDMNNVYYVIGEVSNIATYNTECISTNTQAIELMQPKVNTIDYMQASIDEIYDRIEALETPLVLLLK